MKILKYICLGLVLTMGELFAGEPQPQMLQVLAQKLAVEYRLRVQAQGVISEIALFDDVGMLGRGVSVVQQDPNENQPIAGTGEGRLPDPIVNLPSEALSVSSVSLEMNHIGFDPLLDLQWEIQAVQKEIQQLGELKQKTIRNDGYQ
ncbi:MAG: hypothetical protein ACI8V2_000020 [Candidatus Latescibacterota bacterium]|jgi:hypothetical protein